MPKNLYDNMADEADAFSEKLYGTEYIDDEFITYGLNHKYDVIVAEALDFILKNKKLRVFEDDILKLHCNNSFLVKSRIIIIYSIMGEFEKLKDFILINKLNDEYYDVWINASKLIETGDNVYLSNLEKFSNVKDNTISSLSRELILLLKQYRFI